MKKVDGAVEVLRKSAALLEKKGADYNSGSVTRDDYALYGRQSHMQMIWTKTLRLRSLIESGNEANFESIQDTLQDLSCYSAIWSDWETRNATRE